MSRIFLSYRRDDGAGYAVKLQDALSRSFGKENVFFDYAAIEPGVGFRELIAQEVGQCDVLLALIGPRWLTLAGEDGARRLDQADDIVRLEVATALARPACTVIPILVRGTAMPAAGQLPAPLAGLAARNAIELSDGRWDYDEHRLLCAVARALGQPEPVRDVEKQRRARRTWGMAAALAVGVALVALFTFRHFRQAWSAEYDGALVVYGRELTAEGAAYLKKDPGLTPAELIDNYAGAVDAIWTRRSINRRRIILVSLQGAGLLATLVIPYAALRAYNKR